MRRDIALLRLMPMQGTPCETEEGIALISQQDGAFCLTLKKADSGVDFHETDYLTMEMCVDMDRMPVMFFDFVEHRGDEEKVLSIRYFMIPTRRVKMTVRLSELDSHRFFLPTYPGTLKGHVDGEPTHIDRIDEIRIRIRQNDGCRRFELYGLWLDDTLPDMRIQGAPMVDEMGQRKGYEWPGKMHSTKELTEYLQGELEKAKAIGGYPEGWSSFGGYTKISFDKTGYFHTHHDGKRWWLVDPEGYAFYSNGVCYGSRMGVHGFVDGMETMFDWLPDHEDPMWKDCWTEASEIPEFVKRNGKESGKGRRMFNFARANMIRAFGSEGWWDAWVTINAARLKHWGINTIGVGVNNYMDEHVNEYLKKAAIPFVWTLKEFPLTKTCIYRDFPDVFSPEYEEGARRFALEQLSPFIGNPYMIGYFITNEPEWLFQASVNPAERVLAYSGHLYSKDALIEYLKARYKQDIHAFNAAWGLDLGGFDALQTPIEGADGLSDSSRADLEAFRDILIAKYSAVPSQALRAVDPDHMNLGMRYARLTPNEFAGNAHFDICSFNCYQVDPTPRFDIVAEKDTRPGLVGEWHIAGDEMRNIATGLIRAYGQVERTKACIYYMEQAMAHTCSVGAHYFEMNDQPVLGRFDGECMQHGLITICNMPYAELTQAMETLAEHMYDIVCGITSPTQERGHTQQLYH